MGKCFFEHEKVGLCIPPKVGQLTGMIALPYITTPINSGHALKA